MLRIFREMNFRGHILKALFALLLLYTGGFSSQFFAQTQRCHADEQRLETCWNDQEYADLEREMLDRWEIWRKNKPAQKTTGTVRTIPVVVHLIQSSSTIEVSDARVLSQIEVLNEDYRRLNADSSNTRSQFTGVAADCEIEFCLAKIDPLGCPTNGINRVVSPTWATGHSRSDETNLKALIQWPPEKYLNIWVPESMSGSLIGYGTFPPALATRPEVDGVVVGADYFGRGNGTPVSLYDEGRSTTHEIGHWLGLEHPWLSGCSGTSAGNCATSGDYICDTPPQGQALQPGCQTNANTCSESPNLPDLVENFMQYSDDDCMNMFTQDQKDRMWFFLDNERQEVWSAQNLTLTGCDGTTSPGCGPFGEFAASDETGCTGTTIQFSDLSDGIPAASSWQWSFGDGGTSTQQNPSHTYAAPGTYDVTLIVTNAVGSDTIFRPAYINIGFGNTPQIQQSFEPATFPPGLWTTEDVDGIGTWTQNNDAATSGSHSAVMQNYQINSAGTVDYLLSPLLNLSQATSLQLSFELAYQEFGYNFPDNPDRLVVEISTDCGGSWTSLFDEAGPGLATTSGFTHLYYVPAPADWEQFTFDLAPYLGSSQAYIRFSNYGEYGQNVYLDDIQLDGVLNLEPVQQNRLKVWPNPFSDQLNLQYSLNNLSPLKLSLFDLQGREIISQKLTPTQTFGEFSWPLSQIPTGLYLLKMEQNGQVSQQKVICSPR